MKCQLFFIALLGAAAFASPVPQDEYYDPDCVEEGDTFEEPAPEIGGEQQINDFKPGQQEPAIRIGVTDAPVEDATSGCVSALPSEGPETDPVDPCVADPCLCDPCADGCPAANTAQCNPCLADVCAEGCEQPCSSCPFLPQCIVNKPTDSPKTDGGSSCGPTEGPEEDVTPEVEYTQEVTFPREVTVDNEAAHVVPDEFFGESEEDEVEDCVEELEE